MARTRRSDEIELNSDGLTDAVTNLTGTLILLVVLMFGITHAVQPEMELPPPAPENTGKPVGPLLRKIEMLRREIQNVDGQIRGLEQRIPALEQEVERLRTEAAKRANESSPPPPRDRVVYHWPLNPAAQSLGENR